MAVRKTISLPDDLKEQMDAVEMPVNWSGEAAKCFRRVLGEIAERKREKDMSDVEARLKASQVKVFDEQVYTVTVHKTSDGRQHVTVQDCDGRIVRQG